ncbi:hypothetical protein HOY82DRAFT_98968 [Tuber indicum]|nr:hypothetical protein HOY82DRAFT_98968 [Tuber indicum]
MPSTVPASLSTAHNSNSTGSRAPFSPLPSEIPRTPLNGHFEGLKSHEESLKTPITPPAAYTEFLKNAVSSPAIQSPRLPPPDLGKSYGLYTTPTTPYTAARRLKIPASPSSSNCSPSTESPASSTSRSPSYEEVEGEVRQGGQRQVTVKQVVTTTVTFRPRMSLMPAPKGKKRRID